MTDKMAQRRPNSTASLLQRANSQLKGEKIKRPEDELNAYISSLTQKTSQKKSVNFEDLGDSISISSELEDAPYQPKLAPSSSVTSKFLKKKPSSTEPEEDEAPAVSKFLKKPQLATSPAPATSYQNRYGSQPASGRPGGVQPGQGRPGLSSSALDKASALTGKIQQRAATRRPIMMESDSDESFSAMKLARTSGEQISESVTTESVKIGRDGGKFLKKAGPTPSPASVPTPKQTFEPPLMSQSSKGRPQEKQQSTPQKKASPYTLRSSLKYSTDVVLTSEEESMAEFIGGLPSSSGDSFEKPVKQTGRTGGRQPRGGARQSPSPPPPAQSGRSTSKGHRSTSPNAKPPVIRRTPSPISRQSPSPTLRRRSPSPKLLRSYSDDSNVAESINSEVAEDYDIGVNIIMDLDDLGPADEDLLPSQLDSRSESPFRATARKSDKEEKKPRKSALKSNSDTSLKDNKRGGSPFKASRDNEPSIFKVQAKSKKEKSPFKANTVTNDSPFKSSGQAKESSSPFKASNKENKSPFSATKVEEESPFKAKTGSSPFKSSGGSSLFKASDKDSSPFKAGGSSKKDKNKDRSSSPFKAQETTPKKSKSKMKKKKKSKSKSKKNETSDLFSSFGLQTVEDLFGGGHSIKESEYESVLSEVDEVKSEITEEIKTERPSMYSYSAKFDDSETEIVSEVEGTTRPSGLSYTEDVESVSERIGYSSDRGVSSASEVQTRYSGEETGPDYTEYTVSESDTETIATNSRTVEDLDEETYTETFTSYTEDFTKSMVRSSRSDLTPRPPHGMMTAGVQTTEDGLQYTWRPQGSGLSFPGVSYGMGFVDPTPIASHVVSADALEALTAYSPAMIALHDMLKSQLDLTKDFLHTQKQLYDDLNRNIESTYHYTTLEDTKNYIKKNKKKKLTFKEALKLVDLEAARR